jgi:selenocysteine lyase/cysteine desulfurase
MRVGVIGAGAMGRPIAVNCLAAGHSVIVGRATLPHSEEIAGQGLSLRYGTFYAYRYCRDQGLDARHGVLRASFAHYNSMEDVGQLIDVLKAVL